MKAVLVGTDLLYRADGSLVPIEINTQVALDRGNREETLDEMFDFGTYLMPFIQQFGIDTVYLEGTIKSEAYDKLVEACPDLTVIKVNQIADFEEIEDTDDRLIIRSSYSDEALVDSFCKDKVNYLKAIQNTELGVPFASKTEEGTEFVGTFEILDNGVMPNFIDKCILPLYDRTLYPRCLKFSSTEQIENYVNNVMEEGHHLVPFHFSEENLYQGNRIKMIRNWSLMVVTPDQELKAISIGNYTKVGDVLNYGQIESNWNTDVNLGSNLEHGGRNQFIIGGTWEAASRGTLLEEGDLVFMSDGTWKAVENIDILMDQAMALNVPVGEGVDITQHTGDYNSTLSEWQSESGYQAADIKTLSRSAGFQEISHLVFTDDTDWFDTDTSSYPVVDPADQSLVFKTLDSIAAGDVVIMLDGNSSQSTPTFVAKTIQTVTRERRLITGYSMVIESPHIILTKTGGSSSAYISVEHNSGKPVVVGCNIKELQPECSCCDVNPKDTIHCADTSTSGGTCLRTPAPCGPTGWTWWWCS